VIGSSGSCQEATYAPQQTAPPFNRLVGAGMQHREVSGSTQFRLLLWS
jgi:hypothetical protein